MPPDTEAARPRQDEVTEKKPPLESAKDDADFRDAAREALPLPETWWRRWPMAAVFVTILAVLGGIGHIVGGLDELVGHIVGGFDEVARLLGHPSVENHSRPLAITLSESETRSLDGYIKNEAFRMPQPLACSTVLAGGVQTRVILQSNPQDVVEISRLSLEAKRVGKENQITSLYQVDPTRQSAFGAARPRTFKITFDGNGQGSAFYINERSEPEEASLSNLLATKDFSFLRLDAREGFQETLDFVLVPTTTGLFEVNFSIFYVSRGKSYEETTRPICVGRK